MVSGFARSGYRSGFGDFWVILNFLSQCMDGTDSLVFAAGHLFYYVNYAPLWHHEKHTIIV